MGQLRGKREHVAARHLQQGTAVVLGKHSDRRFECGDGLEQILLLSIEFGKLLLTDCGRFAEGLLVRCNLGLEVPDLSAEP
eukprot:CAMPEP_0117606848 /NCGR_PEP_ID=MMETSP0784-20121206/79921_1 /TAXON_ID=39447 /ORGANISM="" /LENGTH=80 /DNA_ID=CAMNT_0005409937 /DNA_START=203 /DNA_END=445 /DNA_ORIENTATION=+